MEKATFGAGCFWGVQTTFDQVPGVLETAVGYEGGTLPNPTYKDVCTDRTGHAEVLEVEFDPEKVSYQKLLDVFFSAHDPTQLNRQGPDYGKQYRSVIFYHSAEQKRAAEETIARLTAEKKFSRPIVTQVVPAETFWRAEEYHQKYLEMRGVATCHI
jgi:peptide-methionine (S)-S-oxide reductase